MVASPTDLMSGRKAAGSVLAALAAAAAKSAALVMLGGEPVLVLLGTVRVKRGWIDPSDDCKSRVEAMSSPAPGLMPLPTLLVCKSRVEA